MLILTRRRGESVDLSYSGQVLAVIKVLEFLPNDTVRLGFEAHPHVAITRDNIKERKDHGNTEDNKR